jgi:hypothetical protein
LEVYEELQGIYGKFYHKWELLRIVENSIDFISSVEYLKMEPVEFEKSNFENIIKPTFRNNFDLEKVFLQFTKNTVYIVITYSCDGKALYGGLLLKRFDSKSTDKKRPDEIEQEVVKVQLEPTDEINTKINQLFQQFSLMQYFTNELNSIINPEDMFNAVIFVHPNLADIDFEKIMKQWQKVNYTSRDFCNLPI